MLTIKVVYSIIVGIQIAKACDPELKTAKSKTLSEIDNLIKTAEYTVDIDKHVHFKLLQLGLVAGLQKTLNRKICGNIMLTKCQELYDEKLQELIVPFGSKAVKKEMKLFSMRDFNKLNDTLDMLISLKASIEKDDSWENFERHSRKVKYYYAEYIPTLEKSVKQSMSAALEALKEPYVQDEIHAKLANPVSNCLNLSSNDFDNEM